jgi:hypothetical protein
MSSLLRKLAGISDDEVVAKPKSSTTSPQATPSVSMSFPITQPNIGGVLMTPTASTSISSNGDEVYQKVFAKTDFDQTEIGQAVRKYLDPLVPVIADESTRIKVAVTQSMAQHGFTLDRVLAVFDELSAGLQGHVTSFAAKQEQFVASEITAREAEINDINTKIAELQQRMTQVVTELSEARSKHAQRGSLFSSAVQRRTTEIEQQKTRFAALLKG